MYVNANSKRNQAWNKNKEIYIFTCFLKNAVFLCRVKIFYQQFLTFLSFMNVFGSSRWQMFFKVGALNNFAIFGTKKRLQHRRFPVIIAKFLRIAFSKNLSSGCFCIILKICIILKVNKQLFQKAIFKEISLLWRLNKYFSPTRFTEINRLMYKNSNSFVYKMKLLESTKSKTTKDN